MSASGSRTALMFLGIVTLLASVPGWSRLTLLAAQPDEASAKLKGLLKQRRDAAQFELDACQAAYFAGETTLDQVLAAMRYVMAAELDLSHSPAERAAVLYPLVDGAARVEREVKARRDAGGKGGSAQDYAQALRARLDAEITLLRELIQARRSGEGPLVLVPRCNPAERDAIAAFEALGGRVVVDTGPADALARALYFLWIPERKTAAGHEVPAPLKAPNRELPVKLICELKGLQTLDLGGFKVTDAQLALLKALPELRHLSVEDSPLTDAGMAHLCVLKKLELVNLAGTQVTDAGMTHLKKLAPLQYLGLQRTKVSKAAIERLKAALPATRIEWEESSAQR